MKRTIAIVLLVTMMLLTCPSAAFADQAEQSSNPPSEEGAAEISDDTAAEDVMILQDGQHNTEMEAGNTGESGSGQTDEVVNEQAAEQGTEPETPALMPQEEREEAGNGSDTPILSDISGAAVGGIKSVFYRGTAVTLPLTVTLNGITLVKDRDYSVGYKNNNAVGKGTVVITGIGKYKGTIVRNFNILYYGWRKVGGKWRYYNQNGSMRKNAWARDTKGWCWLLPNGNVCTKKWIKYKGEWYYLDAGGHMVENGWAKDRKGWCWLGQDGKIVRSKWITYKGEPYYLQSNGYMAADRWLKNTQGWCYAGSSGRLLRNQWKRDTKRWCWLDAAGYWDGGKWYKDNKGWFYKDKTGAIAKNRWMRDNSGMCWVGEDGYYDASKRYYQNPPGMIQISTSISKHGLSYYTSPVKVTNGSTRSDHIETMIRRAYDYLGDPFVVCQSRAPGKGVDCSGLVMQAAYAAGIDLWPSNPSRHRTPSYEYESREIWKLKSLESVAWKNRQRGDLIFYANQYGTIIHIAIYLGNDKIVHAYPNTVRISSVYGWGNIKGVKRIFH